ncbi:cytochrome c family protein [bacterium]|nr:cytochrome c family protein [bacterium]MBU1994955.1 cytochrome c family protein [bacterium]
MKKVFLAIFISMLHLFAAATFESSQTCKTCHPIIYDEFTSSSHRNASIFNDPIHRAVWDKHPLSKEEKYTCAKCHTPTDKKLLDALESGESALPQDNKIQTTEAITCIYCHSIQDVQEHAKSNTNILTTKEKTLFSARDEEKGNSNLQYKIESSYLGLLTKKSGSPFHDIDFSNKIFYNANMCIGCHSHKQNKHDFDICKMDIESKNTDKENCISCHMPLVQGSFTTAVDSQTHRYHGFAGSGHKPQMLAQYVKLSLHKNAEGFEINIKNGANHQLLLHPLRVGELQVNIIRNKKAMSLAPVKFMRIIGKDGKPTMPWLADTVLEDSHIKANETRKIKFSEKLHSGDVVEVRLGHYSVNPKAVKMLGLEQYNDLTKFTLFKKESFMIK